MNVLTAENFSPPFFFLTIYSFETDYNKLGG